MPAGCHERDGGKLSDMGANLDFSREIAETGSEESRPSRAAFFFSHKPSDINFRREDLRLGSP
jgi:hypothetical protein